MIGKPIILKTEVNLGLWGVRTDWLWVEILVVLGNSSSRGTQVLAGTARGRGRATLGAP